RTTSGSLGFTVTATSGALSALVLAASSVAAASCVAGAADCRAKACGAAARAPSGAATGCKLGACTPCVAGVAGETGWGLPLAQPASPVQLNKASAGARSWKQRLFAISHSSDVIV